MESDEKQQVEERSDCRWQAVTCSACGRKFTCTPSSDYYNNTTLEDGVCEPCLLKGEKGANPPIPGTIRMTPGLRAAIDSGLVELSPDLEVISDQ
jgi:hypothetical protein